MNQLGSWWFITLLMLIHFTLIKSKTRKRSFSKDKDYVETWTNVCVSKKNYFDVINFSVSELIDNAIICFRVYQEGLNYKLKYFNIYWWNERRYHFKGKLYRTLRYIKYFFFLTSQNSKYIYLFLRINWNLNYFHVLVKIPRSRNYLVF